MSAPAGSSAGSAAGSAVLAERPQRADARRNRERVLAAAEEYPTKQALRDAITELVSRAQQAGAVRDDMGPADMALLFCGIAQSAVLAGDVDPVQRRRYLTIVLDGLKPADPTTLPGRPLDFDQLERARKRRARRS